MCAYCVRAPLQGLGELPTRSGENVIREPFPCAHHTRGTVPHASPTGQTHPHGPRISLDRSCLATDGETGTESPNDWSKTTAFQESERPPPRRRRIPGTPGPSCGGSCMAPAPTSNPGTDGRSGRWQLGDARPHTAHTQAFVLGARTPHRLPW